MTIDSLGSATNSNFQSGPSINATGRADVNTSTSLSIAHDTSDASFNIFRHELLLSRIKSKNNAYVNVISRDSIPTNGATISSCSGDLHLPAICDSACSEHEHADLDMSISTYYADLGDARTDLEYYMAYNQISLHAPALSQGSNSLVCVQQNLKTALGNPTRRRHAYVFYEEEDQVIDDGVSERFARVSTHSEHAATLSYLYSLENKTKTNRSDTKTFNGTKVFYINTNDTNWTKRVATKSGFKYALMEIFATTIVDDYKPKVTIEGKSNGLMIEAPEFRYAGVALTDAHMHATRGDTAVTVNHYSALTTQNGPFDIYVGDDVGWMFNAERKNLISDGNRKARNVLTYGMLHQLLISKDCQSKDPGNKHTAGQDLRMILVQNQQDMEKQNAKNNKNQDARITADSIGALKDAETEARGKYRRFLFVPLKHGSHITKRMSIMDRKRRIGKAISSSKAYGRIDWINGASSEM